MKKCNKCHVSKLLKEFHKDSTKKDKLSHTCKKCKHEYRKLYYRKNRKRALQYNKEYRINNAEKLQSQQSKYYHKNKKKINRKYYIKALTRRYKLTIIEYRELLKKQNKKCLICKCRHGYKRNKLVVDHDKQSKKIRALLCKKCNAGLGFFNHDKILLNSAIEYLKEYKK